MAGPPSSSTTSPVPSLHPPPPAILKHSPDALPDEVVRDFIILLTEQDWEQPGSKYSENRYVFGMVLAKTPNSVRFSDFRNHWKPWARVNSVVPQYSQDQLSWLTVSFKCQTSTPVNLEGRNLSCGLGSPQLCPNTARANSVVPGHSHGQLSWLVVSFKCC